MIELQHQLPEPPQLEKFRRNNPNAKWDDPAFGIVKPIIRQQLNIEQDGLCVYCELSLDPNDGHIEHIRSKTLNPALRFRYENMAHSCNETKHCGHKKGKQVLPIEPGANCNSFFSLSEIDGRISARISLNGTQQKLAETTLTILGLNHASLAWRRKGFATTIRALDVADVPEFLRSTDFRWILRSLV